MSKLALLLAEITVS